VRQSNTRLSRTSNGTKSKSIAQLESCATIILSLGSGRAFGSLQAKSGTLFRDGTCAAFRYNPAFCAPTGKSAVYRVSKCLTEIWGQRPDRKIIDVKQLISDHDVVEHIRRSEAYYKDFSSSHWQFRKPFMGFEAAQLTTRLGVVLSNLDFFLEARLLDFGACSGWLSRSLALMGGNTVALVV
jgi:hypothetical protein